MNKTLTAPASGRNLTTKRLIALCLMLVIVALSACAGGSDEAAESSAEGADHEAPVPGAQRDRDSEFSATGGGSGGGSGSSAGSSGAVGAADDGGDLLATTGRSSGAAAALPDVGPSVIKTASVDIGVPDDEVDESINDAIAVAGRYGGFVLSSQLRRRDSGGTLTMRIPAERFEAALADLEALGKVGRENISGEDVGQEFVDLQARLRNWESQEAVLLKLMERAESVIDTIRVQNELSRVQMEVEQLRGRLTYLRDQTSLGTITASFGPLSAPAPDAPSRFAQAWSRALELMQSFVAGMIVALGVLVPLAVIALILYLLFRGLRPRLSA